MRIASGKFKGRNLIAPSNLPVRPTTDFAKTGLFNILSSRYNFTELKVLDLCAAPGGKSTHLLSLISKESLLVSNEVIRSRANILNDNISKNKPLMLSKNSFLYYSLR